MAIKLSVAVRNARLDAVETAIGTGAILKIRTGSAPANAATSDTGTVLATINLASDWMAAASAGSKAMSGLPVSDSAADATGFAGHFRIYASDGVTCHWQGTVGQTWTASTVYALGQQVINDSGKVYKCTTAGTSASSGGPTGTGSGITDGTAVWQYVDTVDMILDNTSLVAGQQFSVTSATFTDGNA